MRVHAEGFGSSRTNVVSADNAKRLAAGDMNVDLLPHPLFLRVNAAGVLSMLMENGETVNEDVTAGAILEVSPKQILSPATTAVVTAYW